MATYELKKPFKYASGDELIEASFITLNPPTYKHLQWVTPIKQIVMQALTEISEKAVKADQQKGGEDDGQIGAAAMIQVLYASKQDLNVLFVNAQELFRNGGALIDGEVKFTAPLLEKMDLTDFENLVGTYLANFTVPSLMDGL